MRACKEEEDMKWEIQGVKGAGRGGLVAGGQSAYQQNMDQANRGHTYSSTKPVNCC
jgi:hypothetical protein